MRKLNDYTFNIEDGTCNIHISSKRYGPMDMVIDIEDLELVSPYTWSAEKTPDTLYGITTIRVDGRRKKVFAHRLILPTESPMVVDHIDHDGLNNRRSNLRAVSIQQNSLNRRHATKGYFFYDDGRHYPWRVMIRTDGVLKTYGAFATEEEARDRAQQVIAERAIEFGIA